VSERTYWHFGALALSVAATFVLEHNGDPAGIAMCCSILLLWAGWRLGRK